MFVRYRRKNLERPLDHPLRTEVNPRPRGHLAIHRESRALQLVELLPIRPMADQIGVGDQHPRSRLVRPKYAYGLAGLDQQRFVITKVLQCGDDGVITRPIARGLARAPVDD